MSVLMAFLTAVALILFGGRLLRKRATEGESVITRRYTHPGHGWIRETGDGHVVVGVDDLAQSVIGTVDAVDVPRLLHRVRQGEIGWWVRHGERRVPMISPITGWVVEKNEMVKINPTLVNTSPLGDGWLFKVRPARLSTELHNLMTGTSVVQWLDTVRAQLARIFTATPALMYQDGGVMLHGLADRCSDEEWNRVVKEFFRIDEQTMEKKQ